MDNNENYDNISELFNTGDEYFENYDNKLESEEFDLNNNLDEELFNKVDKPYREKFIIPIKHIIRIEENDNKNEVQ